MEHGSSDQTSASATDKRMPHEVEKLTRTLEPNERLDHLATCLRIARSVAGPRRVELYSRASIRARVSCLDGAHEAPIVHVGFEDGLAVRLADIAGGTSGFAACAGSGPGSLQWMLDRALRFSRPLDPTGWADGADVVLTDREPVAHLPSPAAMGAWLETAIANAGRAGISVRSSWVEVAVTAESFAADGGLLASRRRSRAWALAMVEGRPRFLGAPTLDVLDASGWARRGEEPHATPDRRPPSAKSIVLLPEAASALVPALVRALRGLGGTSKVEVGPGWRIADDPLEPRSLYGGWFDDAGFPARRKLLWDGRTETGRIDGPGHLRRGSYRDPPSPMATSLVVAAGGGDPPTAALLVEDLRVHPIDSRAWVLELSGRVAGGGGSFRGAMARVDPLDLPRRCVAALGEARWFPKGVLTPALQFEGLGDQVSFTGSTSSVSHRRTKSLTSGP